MNKIEQLTHLNKTKQKDRKENRETQKDWPNMNQAQHGRLRTKHINNFIKINGLNILIK